MTAWTDLVKKVWNENKKKANFKFKDALILAKKQYKGALTKKKGGSGCAAPKLLEVDHVHLPKWEEVKKVKNPVEV